MSPAVPAPPIRRLRCRDGYIRRSVLDFPPADASARGPVHVEPSPHKSAAYGAGRSGFPLSDAIFPKERSLLCPPTVSACCSGGGGALSHESAVPPAAATS